MTRNQPAVRSTRVPVVACMLAGLLGASPVFAADLAADVVGSWRKLSHTVTFGGTTMDSHAALLTQRPCAAAVRYNINADGTFRLDASASACDAGYKSMQEKLYAKTKWKVGNRFTTSSTNFAAGQTYTVTVSGNRMTWVGTDGQGHARVQR